nr:uncharacterized protein LOC119177753 [Rhipicephalus microplus]XP_037284830.1 uncharacterized protein LOC119177753 [Rhipicephalus microplus]
MKAAVLVSLLTLVVAAPCIAYTIGELKEKDAPNNSLKETASYLRMVGHVLQEKNVTITFNALLADLAAELETLPNDDTLLDENTSEYFLKKLRRVVENVAKAVVVNQAVGAVAGWMG